MNKNISIFRCNKDVVRLVVKMEERRKHFCVTIRQLFIKSSMGQQRWENDIGGECKEFSGLVEGSGCI